MRREGSPWTGLWAVFFKEMADHLTGLRMRILEVLILRFGGGPVGLATLATALSEDPGTLEEVHEPYLIRQGLLKRTPRGRVATELAYRHLGYPPPVGPLLEP